MITTPQEQEAKKLDFPPYPKGEITEEDRDKWREMVDLVWQRRKAFYFKDDAKNELALLDIREHISPSQEIKNQLKIESNASESYCKTSFQGWINLYVKTESFKTNSFKLKANTINLINKKILH